MRWFGENWGAPVCDSNPHASTPAGERCLYCNIPIAEGDQGLLLPYVDFDRTGLKSTEQPHHLHCFMAQLGLPE